jgi:intracellular septation protein
MSLILEMVPVLIFFICFKVYGMYTAIVAGIIATAIQVLITRFYSKKWDNKQLITLAIFAGFGGLSLYFHNPIFVKWKPTIIFWLFSIALLISQWFSAKPLMQRMLEVSLQDKGQIPRLVWQRLNVMWAVFLLALGAVNLYIAYHFSDNAWVNFKFYGILSCLAIFSVIQACYLLAYAPEDKK